MLFSHKLPIELFISKKFTLKLMLIIRKVCTTGSWNHSLILKILFKFWEKLNSLIYKENLRMIVNNSRYIEFRVGKLVLRFQVLSSVEGIILLLYYERKAIVNKIFTQHKRTHVLSSSVETRLHDQYTCTYHLYVHNSYQLLLHSYYKLNTRKYSSNQWRYQLTIFSHPT